MDYFVIKVLVNNMIFMLLFLVDINDNSVLFVSLYVINSFGIDKVVYIKNNFYVK